jgi:hypothetical protein
MMIETTRHLAIFIDDALKNRALCRIYGDVLYRCWSVWKSDQNAEIVSFASEHHWNVEVHNQANGGVIADFFL